MTVRLLAAFALILLLLSLAPKLRVPNWWIRWWDFPRVQLAGLACILLVCCLPFVQQNLYEGALTVGACIFVIAYHGRSILRYTRLFPKEVKDATTRRFGRGLRVLHANVYTPNRNAQALLQLVRTHQPDIFVAVETDGWWQHRLDALEQEGYRFTMKCPLDNFYGMHLYSRLELYDEEIQYLVQKDIPSMHATIVLKDGSKVRIHVLHPAPPAPAENSTSKERDAELLMVGKSVADSSLPQIVCGDLNDVAWSPTTRMFRGLSNLLDPRIGRGLFNTFHANHVFLRWPLDHFFISSQFELAKLERLEKFGSDHFPMFIEVELRSIPDEGRNTRVQLSDDERRRAQRKLERLGASPDDVPTDDER